MFIGQINLSEARAVLGAEVVPTDGVLSFFFDASGDALGTTDPRAVAVYRFPADDLQRHPPNEDLNNGELQSCAVQLIAYPSLPPVAFHGSLFELILPGKIDSDTRDALGDFPYQLGKALLPTPSGDDRHQFLGYPLCCQQTDHFVLADRGRAKTGLNALKANKRAVAIRSAATWSLIAQFDEDKHLPLRWVDTGVLSVLAKSNQSPVDPPHHPTWILDFM